MIILHGLFKQFSYNKSILFRLLQKLLKPLIAASKWSMRNCGKILSRVISFNLYDRFNIFNVQFQPHIGFQQREIPINFDYQRSLIVHYAVLSPLSVFPVMTRMDEGVNLIGM